MRWQMVLHIYMPTSCASSLVHYYQLSVCVVETESNCQVNGNGASRNNGRWRFTVNHTPNPNSHENSKM